MSRKCIEGCGQIRTSNIVGSLIIGHEKEIELRFKLSRQRTTFFKFKFIRDGSVGVADKFQ